SRRRGAVWRRGSSSTASRRDQVDEDDQPQHGLPDRLAGGGEGGAGVVEGEDEQGARGERGDADGAGGQPLGDSGGGHQASPPVVVSAQAPDCQSSSPRACCTDVHRSPYRRPPQPRATGWPVALSVVTDSQ